MYIVFEGVDTSGKTTQLELLKSIYPDAIFTKEPGGTLLGEKIREILLDNGVESFKTEIFLFLADRAEHFKKVILPNKDSFIFSDRSFISGMAYALANHPGVEFDFLLELNRFALDDTFPDKVFLFKTDEKLIKQRLSKKEKDFIEKRGISYLLQVQENMIKILESLNLNYYILNSFDSISDLHRQIKGLL